MHPRFSVLCLPMKNKFKKSSRNSNYLCNFLRFSNNAKSIPSCVENRETGFFCFFTTSFERGYIWGMLRLGTKIAWNSFLSEHLAIFV